MSDPWLLDILLNRSPEAGDARCQVWFEQLLEAWVHDYADYFEPNEVYNPRDTREAFLKFCAEEFDRLLTDWPWGKKK